MAASDYKLCDVCKCKTFYDDEVDYWRVGKMIVLCEECAETRDIIIIDKKQPQGGKDGE